MRVHDPQRRSSRLIRGQRHKAGDELDDSIEFQDFWHPIRGRVVKVEQFLYAGAGLYPTLKIVQGRKRDDLQRRDMAGQGTGHLDAVALTRRVTVRDNANVFAGQDARVLCTPTVSAAGRG